ncbi:hypothetical protein N7478_003529 [Penicillium angulare]|uniref:uncharacterized protein n=1 Tax=Penicillium angulare TaxID=116970 RepID=UPI00253F8C91|nr:uncharacterized protein N7478_003529 [Penicillium angulare]KAJ5287843.1 hypothetical protein N7478_003529 [Penicillium angulare]
MGPHQSHPHAGGSIAQMPPNGTTIPNDTSKQNAIPSVPRPEQRNDYFGFNIGQSNSASTDSKRAEIPRSTYDRGKSDEAITPTGESIPASVESKHNYLGTDLLGGSTDTRNTKNRRMSRSEFDQFVGDNELDKTAKDGKIGVNQFFGLESSY